jgi:hypothetical protein
MVGVDRQGSQSGNQPMWRTSHSTEEEMAYDSVRLVRDELYQGVPFRPDALNDSRLD